MKQFYLNKMSPFCYVVAFILTTSYSVNLNAQERKADYLAEVWSHTDDMTPKKIVALMENLIIDLKKKAVNESLKIQLDALKSLREKFDIQIPGLGGDQPSVCEWKDMLASVISGVASDSEILVYESDAGVTIGTGTEKSRRNISGILEAAQKTKGTYDAIVLEHYVLTGSTAGFGLSGSLGNGLSKIEKGMEVLKRGKELINKVPRACKEGPDIKDLQHIARANK